MSDILLVEDDRTIREAIELILTKEGHGVVAFRTAEEALEVAGPEPDVLISDYKLPGVNGIELVKRLKMRLPFLESIVITAFGSIDLAVDAIKQGASDFLTKPFSPEELMIKVQ